MKRIFRSIKDRYPVFVIFLIWGTLTLLNMKVYWMLVDDAGNVIFSRTLFEKISSLNIVGVISQLLEGGGRFRPTYWLYQMCVWIIGRNNYQIWHFVHMLVIGATVIFIYIIIRELTKSKIISLFAGLFYLLTPLNTENILRIGPQEPLLTMLLSILFYLIIRSKNNMLAIVVLVLAIFTKETSVAIFPAIFLYYLYCRRSPLIKNKTQGLYLFISICISAAVLVLVTFLRRGGYSTNYYFDMSMITHNFIVFVKDLDTRTLHLMPLAVLTYVVRLLLKLIKQKKIISSKEDVFQLMSFVWFVSFLIIQLPWEYPLTRYLMPALTFLTIFMFLEISNLLSLLGRSIVYKWYVGKFRFLILISAIYILVIWLIGTLFRETSQANYYKAFVVMSRLPKNTIIFMNMYENDGTIELVYETEVHLAEFWNRGDIKVKYLDLQNLPNAPFVVADSDQFIRRYSYGELTKIFGNPMYEVKNISEGIVITTPPELIKQSIKKIFLYVVKRNRITHDGIYTSYYVYNNWNFFNYEK